MKLKIVKVVISEADSRHYSVLKRKTPYLDLVRRQAAFHVAALFLGWRRGRLMSRGEVSPVGGKRKQTDTWYPERAFMRP